MPSFEETWFKTKTPEQRFAIGLQLRRLMPDLASTGLPRPR